MDLGLHLARELAPVAADMGLDIDDVSVTTAGRHRSLEIIVDADGGVDMETVARASRAISAWLDDNDVMGQGSYTLEVTSRGVGRPLTKPVHWRRNVGRLVTVTLPSGIVTGRIVSAESDEVTIDVGGEATCVALLDVSHAVIEVEFNRKEDD